MLEELDDEALIAECERLLERMEARIESFEKAPVTMESGVRLFWPVRGLDEINSLGVTFHQRWTQLRIRMPDPPKQIEDRAEAVVDGFLRTGTNVVVPGAPGVSTRDRLRQLLGLSVRDG